MKKILKAGDELQTVLNDCQEAVIGNKHGEIVFLHKEYATFAGQFEDLEEYYSFDHVLYNGQPSRITFETIGSQYFINIEVLNDYDEYNPIISYCANSLFEPKQGEGFFKV